VTGFLERVAMVADGDGRPLGSAFCISDSLLLTAAHVLRGNKALMVRLFGTERFIECATAWTSNIENYDLTLLRTGNAKERALPDSGKRQPSNSRLTPAHLTLCITIAAILNAIPFTEPEMPANAQIVINSEFASIPLSVMIIAALINYFNQK
jgi:hypothetical protein